MGTYTTNKNLFMPSVGETGWGDLVNGNFETIDNFLKPITVSGSTYTFTGNHVGNQSGGSISATSISNSGTLTQTGASTFTGKITANGGIGTTSLTTSSTITSMGKITGNGGIAGTTGTFSGAVTGATGVFGNIGNYPAWTLVFSTDSAYFTKYGAVGSMAALSANGYLNIELARYGGGLFPSNTQTAYTYVGNWVTGIGTRPINNIIVKSGSIGFGLTCSAGNTTCTIDGKTGINNSYTSINQNDAINYLAKMYTVTFTYSGTGGYADKPTLRLGIQNKGTTALYYMFLPNILPI